ncbi:YqhV family protein [Terribacillus saccharophilus]|uniref:YqhV family protein n=1 Tax=Terribacillus saccharophilus TaxID=361277 RepID=UPI003982D6B6
MHPLFEKAIIGMVMLRLLSGGIEITAALLMLKINDLEKALVINSSLAFVGPLVLIVTTAIGVAGMAGSVSFNKVLWILLGVGIIFYGIRHD